jgi:hypothetical protein
LVKEQLDYLGGDPEFDLHGSVYLQQRAELAPQRQEHLLRLNKHEEVPAPLPPDPQLFEEGPHQPPSDLDKVSPLYSLAILLLLPQLGLLQSLSYRLSKETRLLSHELSHIAHALAVQPNKVSRRLLITTLMLLKSTHVVSEGLMCLCDLLGVKTGAEFFLIAPRNN